VSEYETIVYEEIDGVAVVTLNRPEVHNAFNRAMVQELGVMWRSLRANDAVRAIVLTGAGDEAFCTGIDRDEAIEEYLADPNGQRSVGRVSTPFMFNSPGVHICPKQCDLWKPVVAAVNGMACGGALYMLGESDIIIAAEHATFFDPHVSYGMVSAFESIHILQKLPLGETLRLALMGANERIGAERAYQVGLISEITAPADLRSRALEIATAIAAAPALAVQATLRTVWMAHDNARREAFDRAPAYIHLGTAYQNIEAGQKVFKETERDYRVR
jgi:enoyl-CoA hydratase/carnithine racemase